jgi:acetyl esterase
MPLSPESQIALDSLTGPEVPALDALPPQEAQSVFNEIFKTQPEDQEDVAMVLELSIPGPGGEIRARLYKPAEGELPVMMHFHGGGFVLCNLDTHDGPCRAFANRSGCAVVAVEYRKAPVSRFPAATDDCLAATRWVHDRGSELGVDRARMGVMGDSAGGNLAAVTAIRCRDKAGPALRLQILNYPCIDATLSLPSIEEKAEGYFLTKGSMEYFWGHYLGDSGAERNPLASPLFAPSLEGLPPAFVVTAEYDPLRDEGNAYAKRLRDAGVEVVHEQVGGTIHGFLALAKLIPDAERILVSEAEFARSQFGVWPPVRVAGRADSQGG